MQGPDLTLLIDAAKASGDIALKHFRSDPEIWDKGDGQGPVTEADLEINRMLESDLRSARPDYGWLSEETEDGPVRLSSEHVFIVDPIDGTRAFIEGHENFSHSYAVVEKGEVQAAVVFLPAKSMLFTAELGRGAFLNGDPITPSTCQDLEKADILAAEPQLDASLWSKPLPPFKRSFRSSLAYRLALVANGRFDAMITHRPAWEWDIAAGDLICREAGAKVTTTAGELPVYNNAHPKVAGVIAAPKKISAALLDLV